MSDATILHAAGRAISRLGPARLTLADVAAEAGVAPPTLLQRFGSKRGLLLAFAARGIEGARRAFAAARTRMPSPLEAVVEALVGMTAAVATREAMANHLAFLQMDLADPEFHAHARTHAVVLREEIGACLDRAVARGELPAAETGPAARAVHAAFNGALLAWAVDGEGTVEQAVRDAVGVVLRGLDAEGRRRAAPPPG
ncbi:MAG TPA: helix-turn-helix domain-containing protein [Longimicrobium sp.]|nr:helix-turn-helix domain-containing protein [Longimicrobium sp.]